MSAEDPARRAGQRPAPLSWRRALWLGVLQGPCELLPISSSGHLELIPWLLGREGPALEPELRKALQTAAHAGTVLALLRDRTRTRWPLVGLATVPPAVAGVLLGPLVERRLSGPGTIVAGLAAGSVAMLLADGTRVHRRLAGAGAADALWVGLGQAAALVPGVSRSAATASAARARGFSPADASHLSDAVALPVLAGAAAWQTRRVLDLGLSCGEGGRLLATALAAAGSTAAARRLLPTRLRTAPLAPFAAYRLLLAGIAGARLASRARLAPRGTAEWAV